MSLERLSEDLIRFSQESYYHYAIALLIVLPIFYACYKYTLPLLATNKIATSAGVVAFIIAYLFLSFAASYGKGYLDIINPGVFFFCLLAFFAVFFAIKYCFYGFEVLSTYFQTGKVSRSAIVLLVVIPFALLLMPQIARLVSTYHELVKFDGEHTYSVNIEVVPDKNLDIYITEFYFSSGIEKRSIKLEQEDINEVNEAIKNGKPFTPYLLMPKAADSFKLSWYSFKEKKYYSDTFPFPVVSNLYKTPDSFRIPYGSHNQAWLIGKLFPALLPERVLTVSFRIKDRGALDIMQGDFKFMWYEEIGAEEKSEEEFNAAYSDFSKIPLAERQDAH